MLQKWTVQYSFNFHLLLSEIEHIFKYKPSVQLTLEQHRFELHRSVDIQILFSSKYYSVPQSMVGWIWACRGTTNAEGWLWIILGFSTEQRVSACSRVNCIIFCKSSSLFFPHTFSLFIVCLDLAHDGFCFSFFSQIDMFYFYMVRSDSLFLYSFLIWLTVFLISRLLKSYLVFSSSSVVSFLPFKSLTDFR